MECIGGCPGREGSVSLCGQRVGIAPSFLVVSSPAAATSSADLEAALVGAARLEVTVVPNSVEGIVAVPSCML